MAIADQVLSDTSALRVSVRRCRVYLLTANSVYTTSALIGVDTFISTELDAKNTQFKRQEFEIAKSKGQLTWYVLARLTFTRHYELTVCCLIQSAKQAVAAWCLAQ